MEWTHDTRPFLPASVRLRLSRALVRQINIILFQRLAFAHGIEPIPRAGDGGEIRVEHGAEDAVDFLGV